jgi:hypothetical protein
MLIAVTSLWKFVMISNNYRLDSTLGIGSKRDTRKFVLKGKFLIIVLM